MSLLPLVHTQKGPWSTLEGTGEPRRTGGSRRRVHVQWTGIGWDPVSDTAPVQV